MLAELISFSKVLRERNVFDHVLEKASGNCTYVVVPLGDIENTYFVVEDIVEPFDQSLSIKKIEDEEETFREVLKSAYRLTRKLPDDLRGNKSIGGNRGVNSYNFFMFEISGIPKTKKREPEELERWANKFHKKLEATYAKEYTDLNNYLDDSTTEFLKEKMILDEKDRSTLTKLIYDFVINTKITERLMCVFKLPEEYYSTYEDFYLNYTKRKIFKKDDPNLLKRGKCPVCGECKDLSLPSAFNNLNEKKLFITHKDRKEFMNTLLCRDCCYSLFELESYFLKPLKLRMFPIFITQREREEEIKLLNQNLEKLSFETIIKNIHDHLNEEVMDFYLLIYQNSNIVFLDYISGFRMKFGEYEIFDLLKKVDSFLFESKLRKNFFTEDIDKKNKRLEALIYKYRTLFFDFFYRAKYTCLNEQLMNQIFVESLAMKLKKLYTVKDQGEFSRVMNHIKTSIKHYEHINKAFGGDIMDNVSRIEERIGSLERIENSCEFYYLLGQIVYYLMSQSEASEKTHALVEPFINVSSTSTLLRRVIDVFEKYKHKISFNNKRFNDYFGKALKYFMENQKLKFSNEDKIYFYAGYFSENIFYQKRETEDSQNEE